MSIEALKPIAFHVLLALSEGPLHGYALVQRIKSDSEDRISVMPGNLYAVLRRLEARGLVAESRGLPHASEDQRRRVFELTDSGQQALVAEARSMTKVLRTLDARRGSLTEPSQP